MDTRSVSPWSMLNLRWNPFGEPPPQAVRDLVVLDDEEEIVEHLKCPNAVLQILGKAGRGKTTRLRLINHRFPLVPYVYLAEDEPLPSLPTVAPQPGRGPAFLLDEAQRLPRRRRRRLFRSLRRTGSTLALASHEDLSAELDAEGLRTRTVKVSGLDEHRLIQILQRRLDWARASGGPLPTPNRAMARELIDEFGDDLRSMLDHLYERYQELLYQKERERRWPSVS